MRGGHHPAADAKSSSASDRKTTNAAANAGVTATAADAAATAATEAIWGLVRAWQKWVTPEECRTSSLVKAFDENVSTFSRLFASIFWRDVLPNTVFFAKWVLGSDTFLSLVVS